MSNRDPIKVLFVCMGNICRSPTAHGIFQQLIDEQDLGDRFLVDSAGTHSYHIGNSPDQRSQKMALKYGIDLSALQARQLTPADFASFDYILAMDQANLSFMQAIKPDNAQASISLMLDHSNHSAGAEVPDPYFGDDGFEIVFKMIDEATRGLLKQIRAEHLN